MIIYNRNLSKYKENSISNEECLLKLKADALNSNPFLDSEQDDQTDDIP